jgi:catechol 2,3-dioxygenase-like lactoylglutathione lyase family enzyme
VNVTGFDHIYLAVGDFHRSEAFYDRVLGAFGFRKGDKAIAGEPHAHYIRPGMQISLRPARSARAHDPYAPGLHHLCLQVESRADVDEAHRLLTGLGVDATPPRLYPEYNDEYYATFFADPDGMRLEVVGRTSYRRLLVDRWHELRTFLNPVAELLARDRERT